MDQIDTAARAELSRLRAQMNQLETRMMGHLIQSAWRWVIAIWLASLALAAAFIVAINKHA
jgi:hypothetical protein